MGLRTATLFQQSQAFTSVKANGRLLDDVCKLRYKAYIHEKIIASNHTKRFFDEYDHKPHCCSYLTFCCGDIAGSVRCCSYQPGKFMDIPAIGKF